MFVPGNAYIEEWSYAEKEAPTVNKRTFTYKIVEGCAIKADVHSIDEGAGKPAIVLIHGGCLIMGGRTENEILVEMLTKAGYTVISIDYRLAPETKLEGILEDLRDAFRWVRKDGEDLLNINPNRMGAMGCSAGGYLTLMSGFMVDTPPKVLVSFYGYSDVNGAWYSKPDPFYRRQPLVAESIARAAVGTNPISETVGPHDRHLFYLYCRQNGLWPKEVTGYDPEKEPRKFDRFSPVRNVTEQYPPTLLLHGDRDTDVPYAQSVAMSKKLGEAGVDHDLITAFGKGHGFDDVGFRDPAVAVALNRVLVFLKQRM